MGAVSRAATPAVCDFRAELLDPRRQADAGRLDALRAIADIEWIDTYASQFAEWQRLPRAAPPAPGMAAVDAESNAASPIHAYYSWARRICTILPEQAFVELRTSRNQHKITRAEQDRLRSAVVGVVGLSVGQSIALTIALERGCGELRLADFDTVELSNLNRIRCGLHQVGMNKAIVAAREIAELDPYLKVVCFEHGYRDEMADAFLDGMDLVVEECDSLDVKFALRHAARQRRIPVLMNTSDRGMTDIERFDLEPERQPFHGRVCVPAGMDLATLDTASKIPLVLGILGVETMSTRLRASVLEIGSSLGTWPQLGADVALGGALVANVARRLLLGEGVESGRFLCDMDAIGRKSPAVDDAIAALPSKVVGKDVLDDVLADAAFAPSAGNAQPWLWQRCGSSLTLRLRPTPHEGLLYHRDRADLVALGAALETAVVAATSRDCHATVSVMQGERELLGPLDIGSRSPTMPDPLAACIRRRRSDRRRPQVQLAVDPHDIALLQEEIARFPQLRMSMFDDRAVLNALADIVSDGERLRMLDPACHRDMMREICWSQEEHEHRREGICVDAIGLSTAERSVLELTRDPAVVAFLEQQSLGTALGAFSAQMIRTSGAVGLLWSPDVGDAQFVAGGRALQRVWLRATSLGLGLCPVTPLCYMLRAWKEGAELGREMRAALPALDRRLADLLCVPDDRADIVLFRLVAESDTAPGPRTLRLPRSTIVHAHAPMPD